MAKTNEIFKHVYDFDNNRVSIISCPVLMSGETFENKKGYTIGITPAQRQTIHEDELDVLKISISINENGPDIKTCMYSTIQDINVFTQKIIDALISEHRRIMSTNYTNFIANEPYDTNLNKKDNAIIKILAENFKITNSEDINRIDTQITEPDILEQNPKYIYEHVYSLPENRFMTNAYIIKSENDSAYQLQSIGNKYKKTLKFEHMEILLTSKKDKSYSLFTKNPDTTDFQRKIIEEFESDITKMTEKANALISYSEYATAIINNIDRHIQTKTDKTELYEFIFKNGKCGIKPHKILQADRNKIYIDNGSVICTTDIDKIITDEPDFAGDFINGGVYRTFSLSNITTDFKKAVKHKLESDWLSKINFALDAVRSRKIRNNNSKDIEQYPEPDTIDLENFIKFSNKTSDKYITLFRLRRNLYSMNGRYIKISASNINYIRRNDEKETIEIFNEPDGSSSIISSTIIGKLFISASGDMHIWININAELEEYAESIKKEKYLYILDRFEYELDKEKRDIEKYINNI